MDPKTRRKLVDEHLDAIRKLETRPVEGRSAQTWPPDHYYFLWHIVVGMMLGATGAMVSLLANAVGAPIFGQRALELIRVYLTFPMGEQALGAEAGFVLFVGCSLYLITGAIYGVAFHLVFSLFLAGAARGRQFLFATVVGVGLWVVNFYLLLSWLQPALLGDNWIVRLVPWWVGLLTHLAFVWTMVVGEAWGGFEAARNSPRVEESAT